MLTGHKKPHLHPRCDKQERMDLSLLGCHCEGTVSASSGRRHPQEQSINEGIVGREFKDSKTNTSISSGARNVSAGVGVSSSTITTTSPSAGFTHPIQSFNNNNKKKPSSWVLSTFLAIDHRDRARRLLLYSQISYCSIKPYFHPVSNLTPSSLRVNYHSKVPRTTCLRVWDTFPSLPNVFLLSFSSV